MKKLMAIFAATLMLAGVATSCSKKCECTQTTTGGAAATPAVTSEQTIKNGKCSDLNSETTVAGITTKLECKQK